MNREKLEKLIKNFNLENLSDFLYDADLEENREDFSDYTNEKIFQDVQKIGDIETTDKKKVLVVAVKIKGDLSERSSRKKQYDLGKKILKRNSRYNAGIFIFYDKNGFFRFSLIYLTYSGTKAIPNSSRRYTYFVSPDPQITNKTFLSQIGDGDFSTLENIKKAFSVEKVTEDFYKDIANWYFWAVRESEFPKDVKAEENGKNIAIIRLITRLIFIWFMRKRGLISNDLFEKKKINSYLKDLSPERSTYYKAILQNLFFATLNTKKEDRNFRSEIRGHKGKNPDFGNQYVYRYHDLFKSPEKLKEYFNDIPFLNGGLFECLDDKRDKPYLYVDGFTATKKNQPIVPNFLFFSDEQDIDLNTEYGTKKKKYKVRGLIDTLSSYNFTIDENDLNDAEVALDPELLGRVFENLLASFNPETSSTARKATGSYYTPREIVDYMVTQSLKEYFKTHLKNINKLDEKIDQLFKNKDVQNPFTKSVSKKLVTLIDNLKIVDPAVGSGAFPMGILNKLVFILGKLDPENVFWKKAQIEAVKNNVTDLSLQRKLIDQINDQFKNKNFDYGRKLYLIQKCIYGVDIQQIAVEITKLRFFIALLVDEKIDKTKENWDIESLPNLDFKIMQGNSLLEEFEGVRLFDEKFIKENNLDKQEQINSLKQKQLMLQREYLKLHSEKRLTKIKQFELNNRLQKISKQLQKFGQKEKDSSENASLFDIFSEAKKKVKEFKKLQKEFFAPELKNKKDIKEKLDKLEWELIETTLREQGTISALKKLEKYKNSKTKPFFLWKLYFAEVFQDKNPGFDIVIANPPYIKERDNKDTFELVNKSTFGKKYHQGKMDFWYYFLHRAIDLTKNNGIISYITSRYWLNSYGARKLIKRVREKLSFLNFIDIGKLKVFNDVVGHHMVAIYKKSNIYSKFLCKKLVNDLSGINSHINNENVEIRVLSNKKIYTENNEIILGGNSDGYSDVVKLKTIADISQGVVEATDKVSKKQFNESNRKNISIGDGIFVLTSKELSEINPNEVEKSILKKYLDPNDIFRFGITWNNKFLIYSDKNVKKMIGSDNRFINIRRHLDKYRKFITSSNKPYGLHRPRDIKYFMNPKIIFKGMFVKNQFAYDEKGYFTGFSFSLIIQKDFCYDLKYILAILNSKFSLDWFLKNGKKRGVGVDIGVEKLRLFPIKIFSSDNQKPFINIVDKILDITKGADYLKNSIKQTKVHEYEQQIDQMVYKLYGLTKEEKEIIEESNKK